MGKSSPQAPAAPNYQAAAAAQDASGQTDARLQARLSNPIIQTPYGRQDVGFTNEDQPVITQTLNPTGQATVDQQQAAQLGLAGLANQQTQRVGSLLNTPFSFSGSPQMSVANAGATYGRPEPSIFSNSITAQAQDQQGGVNAPNLQNGVDQSNLFGLNAAPGGSQYGWANGQIDTSGVAKSPINAGTTAQQAIMSRLQPQLDRQRTSTETQLVNQGLRPGSEAYDNAIRDLGQQENDARQQAVLSGLGLDMQANQQGFGQAQAQQQAGNQAVGQNFNQGISSAQNQAAIQGQQFNQRVQAGEFGNNAQLASFNAGLQNQAAGNQASQQNFLNQLQQQQAQNAAQNQNFQTTINANQFGNQLQNQQFNQNLQAGQFGNTALQQQLAQALQQRDLPLNEINSLMSGSQIQNPQFSPYQGTSQSQAGNYLGAAQAQGAFDQNTYNQQMAAYNAKINGLYNLGGAALSFIPK